MGNKRQPFSKENAIERKHNGSESEKFKEILKNLWKI